MTAERDRLAELIHNDDPTGGPTPMCGCFALADRLTKAGVIVIGDHNPHDAEVFRRGFERGHAARLLEDPPADLDVNRLAAAINDAQVTPDEIALGRDLRVPARRIAAKYRG